MQNEDEYRRLYFTLSFIVHTVCIKASSNPPMRKSKVGSVHNIYSSIRTAPPVCAVPLLLSNWLQQPHYPQHHGCVVLTQWLMMDCSPFALMMPPLSGCGEVSAR